MAGNPDNTAATQEWNPVTATEDEPFVTTLQPNTINFIPTKDLERQIIAEGLKLLPGYCGVCARETDFLLSSALVKSMKSNQLPNWREYLACSGYHFSARMRSTIEIADATRASIAPQSCYITEAVTPLYSYLKEKMFPDLIGSEFLGTDKVAGEHYPHKNGNVRHEDVTSLSFPDGKFDLVMSFDVLEHVSDIDAALRDICRITSPGGTFLLSVPIHIDLKKSGRRALINPDGTIKHLKAPEYHGDPLTGEGVLCFHDFGVDLIEMIHQVGFHTAEFIVAQSSPRMYLGKYNIFIRAKK